MSDLTTAIRSALDLAGNDDRDYLAGFLGAAVNTWLRQQEPRLVEALYDPMRFVARRRGSNGTAETMDQWRAHAAITTLTGDTDA